MEKDLAITLYEPRGIMIATDALNMANELEQKLKDDMAILEKNNSEENQIVYKRNEYLYYWLKFDYYNMISLTSTISDKDIKNGWFIYLKAYDVI